MPRGWQFASHSDADEFAGFSCWDGRQEHPWEEEVENYIRGWVLSRQEYVLAFREDDELVAVSAFDPQIIQVPLLQPIDHPGWRLQVVAIRLERQGEGLAGEVFAGTFEAMRVVDSERVLISAVAHRENTRSLRASASVGITWLFDRDEHYVELLGELPEGG